MIMIDDDNMVISYLFHFSLNFLLAMYSNKLWWLWSSWWWTQRTSKSDHLCAVSGTPASISPMPSPLTRYQKVIYLSRDSVFPPASPVPPRSRLKDLESAPLSSHHYPPYRGRSSTGRCGGFIFFVACASHHRIEVFKEDSFLSSVLLGMIWCSLGRGLLKLYLSITIS